MAPVARSRPFGHGNLPSVTIMSRGGRPQAVCLLADLPPGGGCWPLQFRRHTYRNSAAFSGHSIALGAQSRPSQLAAAGTLTGFPTFVAGAPWTGNIRHNCPIMRRVLWVRRIRSTERVLSGPPRAGLTQGEGPQLTSPENWSLQAGNHPVRSAEPFPRPTDTLSWEFRLKFSASGPVPSPSAGRPGGLGLHPQPPIAGTVLCWLLCRSTNSASPLFNQVKWGGGLTPVAHPSQPEPGFLSCDPQGEIETDPQGESASPMRPPAKGCSGRTSSVHPHKNFLGGESACDP